MVIPPLFQAGFEPLMTVDDLADLANDPYLTGQLGLVKY